jgi:hypothetical protein
MSKKPKVLASIKMPEWFVVDYIKVVNMGIKDLGYDFKVKSRNDKDTEEFNEFLMADCSLKDAVLLKKFASDFADYLWTKVRIDSPKLAHADHLQADYKRNKIHSLEAKDSDSISISDILRKALQ